jgi:hypothetical protein
VFEGQFIKFKPVTNNIKNTKWRIVEPLNIRNNCKELYDFVEKNGRESFLRSLLAP